jgi:hypothetical protein
MSSSPPPSPKHPVVDLTAPPENPELAIVALRRSSNRTKHRRTPVGFAPPEGSYAAFRSAIVVGLCRDCSMPAGRSPPLSSWDENTYRSVNSSRTTDGRCGRRCRIPAEFLCHENTPQLGLRLIRGHQLHGGTRHGIGGCHQHGIGGMYLLVMLCVLCPSKLAIVGSL